MEENKQQVLHKGNRHTVEGAHGEGRQQFGKIRDIQLYERGNQRRNGELDEHQYKGYGGQHGGDSQLVGAAPAGGGRNSVGSGFRHRNTLLCFA